MDTSGAPALGASSSGGAAAKGKKNVSFSPTSGHGGASSAQPSPPLTHGGAVPEPSAPAPPSPMDSEVSPHSQLDLSILNEVQDSVGVFNHELFATKASHHTVNYWPSLKVGLKHVWKGKSFFANLFHLGSEIKSVLTKCLRD
jgi:hypothetical protein